MKFIRKNSESTRILENTFFLSLFQASNYLIPLLTVPYLVRVVGVENFGVIMFAQSLMNYLIILTDYGFNLSATRDISINRNNIPKVSHIYTSVLSARILILLLSMFVLILIVETFDIFKKDSIVFYFFFGIVVGNAIFPIWLFQGLEQMKYITFINFLGKTLYLISIITFINAPEDYIFVPIIHSLSSILSGLLAIFSARLFLGVSMRCISLRDVLDQLVMTRFYFASSVQSNILSSSGVFILGLFHSKEIVGYYSAIEKIVKAIIALYYPITQALYPYSSKILKKNKQLGKETIRRVGALIILSAALLVALLVFLSPRILQMLYGHEFLGHSLLLNLMLVWFLNGLINNFIGIQFLLGLGKSRIYARSFFLATITTLFLFILLTPILSYYGIAIGILSGELVLTAVMIAYIKRRNI